jgi:hypothetical protein
MSRCGIVPSVCVMTNEPRNRRITILALRVASVALAAGLATAALAALTASPASATSSCDPGGDVCVIVPDVVQTPPGALTVTVTAANVVTASLAPTVSTLVIGVPFSYPAPAFPPANYARTSIATSAGLVSVDTIQIPPGPPGRFTLPSLAIISIHPPNPCRAKTLGTTVVFTPITPPGPPN